MITMVKFVDEGHDSFVRKAVSTGIFDVNFNVHGEKQWSSQKGGEIDVQFVELTISKQGMSYDVQNMFGISKLGFDKQKEILSKMYDALALLVDSPDCASVNLTEVFNEANS